MLAGNSIGAGFNHSCAIDKRNRLYVWGANDNL